MRELTFRSLAVWGLFALGWIPVCDLLAQDYWIAGDTSGVFVTHLDKEYIPNASLSLDMDCDGQEDIMMVCSKGSGIGNPWDRLSIYLAEGVQLFNGGEGKVTPFHIGDTIRLDPDYWTAYLDFIYGTGVSGYYGHPVLEDVFLAFRKNGSATARCFIRFSSEGIRFTIHEIHLECPGDPVLKEVDPSVPFIFPNPGYEVVTIRPGPWKLLEIYDLSGRSLVRGEWVETLRISDLAPGAYLIRGVDERNKTHLWKFIKA